MPRQLLVVHFDVAADDRGTLIPLEFADVPFTVRRVFAVIGPQGGASRGNHAVPCHQLLCLLSGTSEVRIGKDADSLGEKVTLAQPGDGVILEPGDFVSYTMADASTSLLVLAEQPYDSRVGQ